jgi:5-methylcytosine-specific restriction enzyme A
MTTRGEFPTKVKLAAFQRAAGRCEECTARLVIGKFAYDHRIADAMGGKPTLENCQVLCTACHSTKSVSDIGRTARAKRQRIRHLGIKKSRTFPKVPDGMTYDWRRKRYVKEAE